MPVSSDVIPAEVRVTLKVVATREVFNEKLH